MAKLVLRPCTVHDGPLQRGTSKMTQPDILPRTVGFWGAALFPVNGMIGAGIFALPADHGCKRWAVLRRG